MKATPPTLKKSPPADAAYARAWKRTMLRIGQQRTTVGGHSDSSTRALASIASSTAPVIAIRSDASPERFRYA